MALNVQHELSQLRSMTVSQLQAKYAEVFGEATNGRHKQWLIKRIAWKMQANEWGGLSERARRRAKELAQGTDLRLNPPKQHAIPKPDETQPKRLPPPGNTLTRTYKGRQIVVTVHEKHFEWDGRPFSSLSAVAKAITGSHMNGYRFFRLDGGAK